MFTLLFLGLLNDSHHWIQRAHVDQEKLQDNFENRVIFILLRRKWIMRLDNIAFLYLNWHFIANTWTM